ncbi:FAD-linked oxidoreductase [Gordonia spumicola]|uniref:FAD-linked oxidoreductase n=1 Tax=Gordonia spumicola TaxID=589161 RepID=A0A7I9V7K9_9ACTN|nr:D-arabinono-1,4-lactone oxidase [Gordonia spumicola]GEE01071.1 FAD-linked oxidoreductase [Gordonia spumicola]
MSQTTAAATWTNWGGTARCTPTELITPQSVDELADAIRRAAENGQVVKPVGAGHSFTEIAVAPGVQVKMSGIRGLISVDADRKRVTLAAGTHLHEIPAILEPLGLGMTNLGDIDKQTISGATSTGTHGTGGGFGGIATQIRGVKLVDGTGTVRTIGEDDPDLKAAALGLGSLGVLTEITLQCVDAFSIRAEEGPGEVDETFSTFLERVENVDHYEFYWFPHTTKTLVKTNTRLPRNTPSDGPSDLRRYIDDELLSNKLLGALCKVGARSPRFVPSINQIVGRALSSRTYTDRSDKIFISDRDVRFREMEYAVPLEAVPDVLREVRAMIDSRGHKVSFPIEVRAAAPDDLMMSTASGRASGYIAVHRFSGDDVASSEAYFKDVEDIMTAHAGRPHWGKMHTRDADYFRSVYPRFDDFLEVRDRFDPQRVFTNPYLTQVLGS